MRYDGSAPHLGAEPADARWSPHFRCSASSSLCERQRPRFALTFDDGPDPTYTAHVLDLLDRHHAKATFFVLGEQAVRHPELVELIKQRGHQLGNHSWDHQSLVHDSPPGRRGRQWRRQQIQAGARTIGPGTTLLRPPFGHLDRAGRVDAWRCRHDVIGWSVDARDYWADSATDVAERDPGGGPTWCDRSLARPARRWLPAGLLPTRTNHRGRRARASSAPRRARTRHRGRTPPQRPPSPPIVFPASTRIWHADLPERRR